MRQGKIKVNKRKRNNDDILNINIENYVATMASKLLVF